MKKSTKLIATAVALVLVVAAMVVGIYAATSAAAGITATVSWEATAGLEFTLDAWTYFSKEQGGTVNSTGSLDYSSHKIETISVDTATTNEAASSSSTGMKRTLNASFMDTTDDGVNNPQYFIYTYCIQNNANEDLSVEVTSYPQTSSAIKVSYLSSRYIHTLVGSMGTDFEMYSTYWNWGSLESIPDTPLDTTFSVSNGDPWILILKFEVLTPDENITNFDASVGFKFAKA